MDLILDTVKGVKVEMVKHFVDLCISQGFGLVTFTSHQKPRFYINCKPSVGSINIRSKQHDFCCIFKCTFVIGGSFEQFKVDNKIALSFALLIKLTPLIQWGSLNSNATMTSPRCPQNPYTSLPTSPPLFYKFLIFMDKIGLLVPWKTVLKS